MTADSPGLAGLGSMGARQWCIITTPRRHIRAAEMVERRRDQELAEKPEVHQRYAAWTSPRRTRSGTIDRRFAGNCGGEPRGVAAGPDDPGLLAVRRRSAARSARGRSRRCPRRCPASSESRVPRPQEGADCVGMDQRQLRGQQVKGAGAEEEARGDHAALPDALGGDPLDRDRRAARDDQAGPARRACCAQGREDGEGPVGPAGLGSLDVHGDRDVGRRAIPGDLRTPAAARGRRPGAARPED